MALIECIECGKPVSTRAASCPNCGAEQAAGGELRPTAGEKSKPARAPTSRKLLYAGLALLFLMSAVSTFNKAAHTKDDPKAQSGQTASAKEPGCDIRKADGSAPDRECDLVELCKDARWLNSKFEQAKSRGDFAELQKAGASLKQTAVWLSAYRIQDVQAVCDGGAMPAGLAAVATDQQPQPRPPERKGCSVTPFEVFPVRYAFTASELAQELAQKCPGGVLESDGTVYVQWEDKPYAVNMATHREPNGLLIHEVVSVRAR